MFRNDGVFWVTFSCVAVLVPAVFVGCQRILNILACGVLGSYSVVLAVDSYSYTSLSHITLNVLRRALSPGFRRAFTSVPLQTTDFIVLAVWGMLAVSGITLQIRRERGRPFFPPHPYKLWKQERERRVTNVLDPSYHIPPLREALQPLSTDQRALPEGTARWGANTTASVKPWRPGQGAARWSPGLAGSAVTGVQLVGDRGVSVF